MLDVIYGEASSAGKVRANNEDAMGAYIPTSRQEARSRGWMFVVADGLGGLDFGEVASSRAVEVMIEGFAEARDTTSFRSLLPRLVQHANAAVHDEGLHPARRGKRMATTIVSCALRYDQATVAYVGDSRCYHLRQGEMLAVTRDHTWVNEQHKLGLVSAAEAASSDARHVLTRSLGPELFVNADTSSYSLKPGDILVLCTDGLHGALYDEDIVHIASRDGDAAEVALNLVNSAVEADGSDNATAQVIVVRSIEPMAMYRGRPYPLPGA